MLEVDGVTLPRVILNICNLCPEILFIDREYYYLADETYFITWSSKSNT